MECKLNLNDKSIYTYEDFNRLENNCKELHNILLGLGKSCSITERTTQWSYSDFVYASEMDRIVTNVTNLKTAYNVDFPEIVVPALPQLFGTILDTRFTYSYFDKIEKNLYYIDSTIKGTDRAILYSGYSLSGSAQDMLRGGM